MIYTESDGMINSADQVLPGPIMNKKSSSKISIFSSSSEIQRAAGNKRKKHTTIFEQEEENFMYQTKPSNINDSLVCIDLNQNIANAKPAKLEEDVASMAPKIIPNVNKSSRKEEYRISINEIR
jgi:hypothetical protein